MFFIFGQIFQGGNFFYKKVKNSPKPNFDLRASRFYFLGKKNIFHFWSNILEGSFFYKKVKNPKKLPDFIFIYSSRGHICACNSHEVIQHWGLTGRVLKIGLVYYEQLKTPRYVPRFRLQEPQVITISQKCLKTAENAKNHQIKLKYREDNFENVFSAFLVLENHMVATKILTLSVIGKKLA